MPAAATIAAPIRLWEPEGPRSAVLLDPAHPALRAVEAARGRPGADDREAALGVAAALEATPFPEAASRAEFIRRQCGGDQADDLFQAQRDHWGIPDFREDLILAEDFRHGFMWRFRDHNTSRSHNYSAKLWFFTSPEARTVHRYEFEGEQGFEGDLAGQGPYRALLEREVAWGLPDELSVLDAPVFILDDYRRFGSDPAFAEVRETLRWDLRDAHDELREDHLRRLPGTLVVPPSSTELRCELARLSLYQGDPDQALVELDRALAIDPADWEAWYYLGITCAITGQRGRAAAAFGEAATGLLALETRPTNVWERISFVALQLEVYGQAIQRLGADALETVLPALPPPAAP